MQKELILQQNKPGSINIFDNCPDFSEKYKCKEKIGEGASSNVFLIENSSTGEEFVAKAFNHKCIKGCQFC